LNSRLPPSDPTAPVELAREAAFRIGETEVLPSTLELQRDGRSANLEPKVMQVLTLLARRPGEVTSRDAMIDGCWGGRFIGEDAIHRTIAKLRQAATQHAGGDFAIETIPRIGYRLTVGQTSAKVAPAPDRPKIAVLAFDNLSGDPETAYFSDGVSEEILQTVSRNTNLAVIARASSFQFRGPAKAAARVSAELKVTHLLDGSVRRSGDRVRIFAELVDCASETRLWSGRFDRQLTDVFALQDEIAAAVATALRIAFSPSASVEPIDPEAYDLYLRERTLALDAQADADRIVLLERAVSRAPRFAAAWAALGNARVGKLRNRAGAAYDPALEAGVREAADTALSLDAGCGLAYASLSRLQPWAFYKQREDLLTRALAASPNDPVVLTLLGGFENHVGRTHEALGYLQRAYELDPLLPLAADVYGAILGSTNHLDAYQFYDGWRTRWPEHPIFVLGPMNRTMFLRDWDRFDALAAEALADQPDHAGVKAALGFASALRKDDPDLRPRIQRGLDRVLAETGTVQLPLLMTACTLGMIEEVFAAVDRANYDFMFRDDGGDPSGAYNPGIIFDRSFFGAAIRDSRFVGLCAKLGLCDYWVETDRWPDCVAWVAQTYDFKAEARRLAHGGRSYRAPTRV
jgi:adenylate cyclase